MAADVDAGYSIFRSKGDAASAAAAAAEFEVQTSGPVPITQFHQVESVIQYISQLHSPSPCFQNHL